MISISTLHEGDDIIQNALRYSIGFEYSGFVNHANHTTQKAEEFIKGNLITKVTSIHGPFVDLMPASIDKDLSMVARKRIFSGIRMCEDTGINRIVFHSGWFPKTYSDDLWISNAVEFWTDVKNYKKPQTVVLIENVYEDRPDVLKKLIDELGDETVRVCLDIGHVNVNSNIDLRAWIEELNERIGHVHFHNNNGKNDDHNGLNTGSINIEETCAVLKQNCPGARWNLEILNNVEESIKMIVELEER